MRTRRVDAGDLIFSEGDRADAAYLIEEGTVEISIRRDGDDQTLTLLGPGEVFGEMSIAERGTAGTTIKASDNGTVVLMIPQESFRHVLEQDESFAVRVDSLIASRRPAPASA